MIRVPSIGIGPTTVSTVCLYLLYLRLFPPRSTSNFYQKSKKENVVYKHVLRKVPLMPRNKHRKLRIDSILSNKDNEPIPVLLY